MSVEDEKEEGPELSSISGYRDGRNTTEANPLHWNIK
jgi:hypothetical protein